MLTMHLLKKTLTIVKINLSTNSCDINTESKKSMVILYNSMHKHSNGWEIFKKLRAQLYASAIHFSGAATNDI